MMWFARYCGSWGGRYTPWSDRVRGLTRGGRETWNNTPSIREGDHEVSRKEATLQLGGILVWYWFGSRHHLSVYVELHFSCPAQQSRAAIAGCNFRWLQKKRIQHGP